MSYVDQTGTGNRTTGIAGVVAVHAVLAAILIAGLTTVVPRASDDPTLIATTVKLPPPPPEPDKPKPTEVVEPANSQPLFVPDPIFEFDEPSETETTLNLPDPEKTVLNPGTKGNATGNMFPKAKPKPEPAFDPIAAKPSNDPGAWVTDNDYKSIWVRREWDGLVGFAVNVSPNGRVTDCRITQSSGHRDLDEATCRLIRQRARFTAARDGKGIKVAGSYSNSVRWQLPD